jgi:hypothetical protein
VSPKRNDRVTPPPEADGWEFRFLTNDAARGWEELCRHAPANLRRAYDAIVGDPTPPTNHPRQHRLRGAFAEEVAKGRPLPQWQYEVTSGGRLWYLVDSERREIWLSYAGTGHPKETG